MVATLEHERLPDILRPRAHARLRQFQREVTSRFPGRIARVVLFGSRARGDARRTSDYDVAVFVEDLSDRRSVDHALADIAYAHILAGVHIRPISVPADYLETAQTGTLASRIARDGLAISDAEA